jgi:hypothetical protein
MLIPEIEKGLLRFLDDQLEGGECELFEELRSAVRILPVCAISAQGRFTSIGFANYHNAVAHVRVKATLEAIAVWGHAIMDVACRYRAASCLIFGHRAKDVSEMIQQLIDVHDKLHAIMTRSVTCLLSLPDNPVHI